MALLEDLEIYIPQEAVVRRVPLHSLPSSVLRKMGLSVELPDPSDCVWICPALFQRKDQKKTPQDQGKAREHMLTVLGNSPDKPSSSTRGSTHWKMSFVTANNTAYRVLKETLPVDTHTQPCSAARVPQGPLSNSEQDAVIIHHGRIYLSVKRRRQELSSSQRSIVSLPRLSTPQGAPQRADHITDHITEHSQMAPVTKNSLKRKMEAPHDIAEMPQPKLSDCGPRGAANSLRANPEASPGQGADLRASRSQSSSQRSGRSQGTIQTSFEANIGSNQSHGDSYGTTLGASMDQEPPVESSDQSPSHAPYMHQSAPRGSTLCRAPSEPLALPNWSPSEPSAQQQDFDYQELESRERIAQMKAKLRKSDTVIDL